LFVRGENKLKQRCDVIILRYKLPVTVDNYFSDDLFRFCQVQTAIFENQNRIFEKIISKNVSQTELDVDDFDGKWAISEKN